MTEKLKEQFAALYKEYTGNEVRFQGSDQHNIKCTCAKAHDWLVAVRFPAEEAISLLIEKQGNGICNVGRSVVYLKRTTPSATKERNEFFRGFLAEMFIAAKKTEMITNVQYGEWKKHFFAICAGHQLEVIFNRLVFAVFPKQFCSVAKPERLLRVCNLIQTRTGIRLTDKMLSNLDWFELCELIVPVVKTAFPDKDFADRSVFLAAIGVSVDGGSREKVLSTSVGRHNVK